MWTQEQHQDLITVLRECKNWQEAVQKTGKTEGYLRSRVDYYKKKKVPNLPVFEKKQRIDFTSM